MCTGAFRAPPLVRRVTGALLLARGWPAAASPAVNPELLHGRDYASERMVATRDVRDAQDSGIRLVTHVWRPLENDRREVVLFSHGSTGGFATKESAISLPAVPLVRFFLARRYTVVAPMRRGRGESTGGYVEECSIEKGRRAHGTLRGFSVRRDARITAYRQAAARGRGASGAEPSGARVHSSNAARCGGLAQRLRIDHA